MSHAFQDVVSYFARDPSFPHLVGTIVSSDLFTENVDGFVPVHLLLHSRSKRFSNGLTKDAALVTTCDPLTFPASRTIDPAPLSVEACLIPSRTLAVRATRAIGVVARALRETSRDAGERPAAAEAVERLATDCLGRALVRRAMLVRAAIFAFGTDYDYTSWATVGDRDETFRRRHDRRPIDRHSTPSCRMFLGSTSRRSERTLAFSFELTGMAWQRFRETAAVNIDSSCLLFLNERAHVCSLLGFARVQGSLPH